MFWGGVPRGRTAETRRTQAGARGRKEREEEREREREKQRVVVVVVVVGVPENGWVGRKKESGVKQQKRKRNIEGGIYRQQPRTFARRHKKRR